MSRARTAAANAVFRLLLPAWTSQAADGEKYSLIVPVPADLPAFCRLALDVLAQQDLRDACEVVIVWDAQPAAVGIDSAVGGVPIQVVHPKGLLGSLLKRLGDPGKNHASQLVLAVNRVGSDYCVLHDADAVPLSRSFFADRYATLKDSGRQVVGVQALWDKTLLGDYPWLVATWEMAFRTSWIKRFPPIRHFAHKERLGSNWRLVDTTVSAQIVSGPTEIELLPDSSNFVHLNYVISTFRFYQARRGVFEDKDFRLLFIRLVSDLLEPDVTIGVPSLASLAFSLQNSDVGVQYPTRDEGAARYRSFRAQVLSAVSSVYGHSSHRVHILSSMLLPFDQYYDGGTVARS